MKKQSERRSGPDKGKFQCLNELKTVALKQAIAEHRFKARYLGIRRDEHGIRAKERVSSPRDEDFEWDYKNQPPELWDQCKTRAAEEEHLRVHPLLGWREIDVWEYVKREKYPCRSALLCHTRRAIQEHRMRNLLYAGGVQAPAVDEIIEELKSSKISERSGRAQYKEEDYMMQKLRSFGHM